MKILFIGLGSIGQRHLRNLLTLGNFEYYAYRMRNLVLPEEFQDVKITVIKDLSELERIKPQLCILAAPPIVQQEVLPIIVKNSIDFFVEKPIGIDLKVLQNLLPIVKEKEIISMVGYNLRYHPIHKRLSQIIDQGLLGNISSIRSVVGQYLPDWHPQEDYRFGYSANKNLGGGAVLDLIHEIDFVYSLFGKVNDIKSFSSKTSHLEIDVEDVAEIIMKFASGILGSVHVDYVNRRGQRDGMILGDEASVKYDLLKAELTIMYKNGIEEIEIFDFVRNKMYRNELSDLLNAISTRVELKNNFAEGLEVLSYANRALNE
jgi:predicted dehydrogenase